MLGLYIIFGIGFIILTSWIIWTLNTELSLHVWINDNRVYKGNFETLGLVHDYITKLQSIHGKCLTDWQIETVRKIKYVEQVDDTLFVLLINSNIVSDELINSFPVSKRLASAQRTIDNANKAIERSKIILNEN